jgi:hypothetical protein
MDKNPNQPPLSDLLKDFARNPYPLGSGIAGENEAFEALGTLQQSPAGKAIAHDMVFGTTTEYNLDSLRAIVEAAQVEVDDEALTGMLELVHKALPLMRPGTDQPKG